MTVAASELTKMPLNGQCELLSRFIQHGFVCSQLNRQSQLSSELERLGAGELLVNSIDRDGRKEGYDVDLLKEITSKVSIPVIACGGAGNAKHMYDCIAETHCSAAAIASILHYDVTNVGEIKKVFTDGFMPIRTTPNFEFTIADGSEEVVIVDYGLGNLMSVACAVKALGYKATTTSDPSLIMSAKKVILPGWVLIMVLVMREK